MKAASIEFDQVTKRYGEVVAVDNVSFTLDAGKLVTFLGPSGCGKTTTLRLIAGLELPSSGTIRIGGRDVSRIPAAERDVSMVFQSYALFPHMSVLENVRYGLDVARVPRDQADASAHTALATVGLNGFDARTESSTGSFALTSHLYAPNALHPDGLHRLQGFTIDPWPTWRFRLEDGTIVVQEIFVPHEVRNNKAIDVG